MGNESRQPLIEEIDGKYSPDKTFELFKDRPYSFFLDSGMDPYKLGRYSFMGSDPFLVMKSRGNDITLLRGTEREEIEGNPFDILGDLLDRYRLNTTNPVVPLVGGGHCAGTGPSGRVHSRRGGQRDVGPIEPLDYPALSSHG